MHTFINKHTTIHRDTYTQRYACMHTYTPHVGIHNQIMLMNVKLNPGKIGV